MKKKGGYRQGIQSQMRGLDGGDGELWAHFSRVHRADNFGHDLSFEKRLRPAR